MSEPTQHRTPEAFRRRLFRQNERVMKFGLVAMWNAVRLLDCYPDYPCILVAGTNGKGQVSAILANIAHRFGFTTGLFTSPHLLDFCERIRVNGAPVAEPLFSELCWDVIDRFGGSEDQEENALNRESDTSPVLTYFECCHAIALSAFRRLGVKFGVFEVGLGGRLDATNILSPQISVITSISLDHMQYLGDTPEKIAREKAGIMRPGCPVVCGRQCHDVLEEEAHRRGCSRFYGLGREFDWCEEPDGTVSLVDLVSGRSFWMAGAGPMAAFQRDNAAVALFVARLAHEQGLYGEVSFEAADDVLLHTRWVGRMYDVDPLICAGYGVRRITLDGAHNEDGVRCFCAAVESRGNTRRALVVNSCSDKAIERMFVQYLRVFAKDSIFSCPVNNPRAMTPDGYCARNGLPAENACDSIESAIRRAASVVGRDGEIYISGSLYLLGEALQVLGDYSALGSIEC